jgi:predicted metal-dependent peptidase
MTEMTRMSKARAKMLLRHPFFATLVMTTPLVETDEVPTAGTDMVKLYYNPEWINGLNDEEEVMGLLAHEVMHIAMMHGLRGYGRNPMVWNIACDFAINLVLDEAGFKLPANGCLDKKYANMSADEIYEQLMQQASQARKQGKSGQPGDGLPQPGGAGQDLMEPKAMNPADEAKIKRGIQQKVAQAANVARMAGKVGAELERLIGEILEPKVPWTQLLRDFMTRTTKDDESWGRRNRRFQNVYLPTRHSEAMGEAILIGDTSGSIGNDELAKYMSEAGVIAEDCKPERIRILWADTRVAGEQVFEPGDPLDPKPAGGGGTDMRVPLEYATRYDPEFVILFTDGYTPWPDVEPDYPLIVCCTTDADCPVGLVVRI